jgi:hypothetical protein
MVATFPFLDVSFLVTEIPGYFPVCSGKKEKKIRETVSRMRHPLP